MRLMLNLDDITLHLRIMDYTCSTPKYEDESWCRVVGGVSSKFLSYTFDSELLLFSEIDYLEVSMRKLLANEFKEIIFYECMEPDFRFVFYPKHEWRRDTDFGCVRARNEIEDIFMEIIIVFWNEEGQLTENSLHLILCREEIIQFHTYLQLVKGDKTFDSPEVKFLVRKGILLD